jgi:antitoxin YefM
MDAITDIHAQENFQTVMNQVCEDHAPVIITRESEQAVVMMSLEDYNSLEETLYLLRSPRNAQRLYKALDELRNDQYQEHDLIENES